MSGLEREWAVMLPNGELYKVPQPPQRTQDWQEQMIVSAMLGARPNVAAERMVPAIFRTENEALAVARTLRQEALKVGVTDLLVTVVVRYCSGWLGSPFDRERLAQQFLSYIETETTTGE